MLDLSAQGVLQYWQQRQDPVLLKILTILDAQDTHILDGDPVFEEKVTKMAQKLSQVTDFELSEEDEFVLLANAMKMSRTVRLLQYLDEKQPGAAAKLLIYAEVASAQDNDHYAFFLNRNKTFERFQLIGRCYDSAKLDLLARSLDKL